MKVFISWSGTRSKAVAEILRDWLKCVIQASQPWISSRDIDRGAQWFGAIGDQLKDSAVGIICLTQENKTSPWILFEAGALAKGLTSNRICTLLIDLKTTDIQDPLAQFNHSFATRESLESLVRTLNRALPQENQLDDRTLEGVFSTYYPQFEKKFKDVLKDTPETTPAPKLTDNQLLTEILEATRATQQRIGRLEEEARSKTLPLRTANWLAALAPVERRRLLDEALVKEIAFKGVDLSEYLEAANQQPNQSRSDQIKPKP